MKLEDYFFIKGTYEFVDGVYNVKGDVKLMISNGYVDKLPYKFGTVSGDFNVFNNKLTTLVGSPKKVGGDFLCDANKLTSLKGCATSIGGDFYCSYNQLISLEGCPISVGGIFDCHNNKLTSLKGCPISVGDHFWCDENLKNTKEYRQYKIMKKLRS